MRLIRTFAVALLIASPLAAQTMVRHFGPEAPKRTIIDGAVAIPFTINHHIPEIDVKINDQGPFHLTVDTGAHGMIVLSDTLAEKLKLETVGEALAADPSGKNPQKRAVVKVDSLTIGGARFEGLMGTVNSGARLDGTDGIIGYTTFHDLLLTFDYPKSQIRLERGELPKPDGKRVLALADRGVPSLELTAGGKTIICDIDAGSPANITLPTSFAKGLPMKGEPRVVGHARTASGEFDILGVEMDTDVTVAGITLTKPRVDLVDHFPVANMGYRFLRNYSITFDAKNKRVSFTPAS